MARRGEFGVSALPWPTLSFCGRSGAILPLTQRPLPRDSRTFTGCGPSIQGGAGRDYRVRKDFAALSERLTRAETLLERGAGRTQAPETPAKELSETRSELRVDIADLPTEVIGAIFTNRDDVRNIGSRVLVLEESADQP